MRARVAVGVAVLPRSQRHRRTGLSWPWQARDVGRRPCSGDAVLTLGDLQVVVQAPEGGDDLRGPVRLAEEEAAVELARFFGRVGGRVDDGAQGVRDPE